MLANSNSAMAWERPEGSGPQATKVPLFLRQSASHMGTQWHLALYSADTKTANAAFDKAWGLIAEIDADLSNYKPDSELNRLCRTSPHEHSVVVGKHLWTVLRSAAQMSGDSNGSFDVTIGPISKLWRRARRKKQLPNPSDLAEALASVGNQWIQFDEGQQAVRLTKPNMQLDLGGIAKGYAVDVALDCLREQGIENALVNGGGDLAVMGSQPNQDGWKVEVANLDPRQGTKQIVLRDAAIATSGDAWQYVLLDGKRFSHIIDPRTGIGTTERKSVSVVASSCMLADSLASALSVLSPNQGLALARKYDAEARMMFATEDSPATINSRAASTKASPKIISTAAFPDLAETDE